MANKIKNLKKIYSVFDLEQIRLKKIIFDLIGISNYLMQDHETEDEKTTDTQKLWKALTETIDFLMEFVATTYHLKLNELKYTDRELEIMVKLKEGYPFDKKYLEERNEYRVTEQFRRERND